MSSINTFCCILLVLLQQLAFSQYTEFRAPNPPIQSMHTNQNGISLADSQNIFTLDSQLQIINQINITGPLEILSITTYTSFLATYDGLGNVNIYDVTTLEHLKNVTSLINPPLAKPVHLIGSQSTADSIALYIAQSDPIGNEFLNRHAEIDLFRFGEGFREQLIDPIRFRELSRLNREYVKVFERDGFVYFLVNQEKDYLTGREVRIVRLCLNDTFYRDDFSAKYELVLSCLPNENNEIYATHAQLISDKLIVAHSTGDSSSICVFNLSEINRLMNEKYYRCVRGEEGEKAGFERKSQVPCQRLEIVGGVCSLGGYLRNGLEVSTALTANAIYSNSGGDWIRGLAAVNRNGLDIVFVGISSGEVCKMLLKSDSIEKIHTYRISPDVPIKLEWDEAQNGVNVQSNNKVYRLPLESCDTLEGCGMCLSSQDPVCGWCSILNSCTQQSECYWNSKELPWVSTVNNNNSNCSTLKLINTPESISVDNNMENIQIEATFLPIRATPYICDFGALGMSNIIHMDSDLYNCPLPSGYKESVTASSIDILVSLRDSETGLVFLSVDRQIRFYNCTKIERCSDCTNMIQNSFSCSWCVHSTTCIDPLALTCDNTDTTATNGDCPTLFSSVVPSLIHSQVPTDVTLSGINLPEPKESSLGYQCIYSGRTVDAKYVNSSHIICNKISLSNPPTNKTELIETIQVQWNGNYLIETVGVIAVTSYSCGNLADDCSQCQSLQLNQELSHYKCGWCKPLDTCHFTPFCESNYPGDSGMCPPAKLTSITPNEGPNLGGTVVTIRGSNLGIQSSDILSVTIGESTCDIDTSKYEPGKVVVCRTRGNLIDAFDVKLTLREYDTPIQGLKYTYSEPKVFGLEPRIGPISGGTRVTIAGEKLMIGSQTSVLIGTKKCEIQTQLSNSDELVCITDSKETPQITTVLLKIDDLMISLSQGRDGEEDKLLKFTYLPDPTVTKVSPSSMFPSGGLSLLIHGTDFNGIQDASMLITYEDNNNNNNNNNNNIRRRRGVATALTKCEVLNESILTCPTPELATGTNTFSSTDTELSLRLQLDSVPVIQGLDSIEFLLQPDPEFYQFESNLTQGANQPILIQGKNFLLNDLEPRHFRITAGERECETRHVQGGLVICYLINTEYSTEALFVEAQVGNIRTSIGYLKLTQESQLLKIILPIVVICLCLLFALISAICLLLFRNHSKKKDVKLYRLIKNLEQLEMGVAQESKKGFTELQTCVEEFDQDITGTKLPFLELRTYLMRILFPEGNEALWKNKLGSNRFLHNRIPTGFKELILNEEFLIQFIAVLEKQASFGVKEKCNVASLLTVCLLTEMDYSTHILKLLLSQLIEKSVIRQQTKLLLRRTDSVGEKLLTNWLAICLYSYIRDHIGTHLYRLSRALKMQLEKGPIDVVTGEARYSLSEEKMLRHVLQEEKLNCFLETGEGNEMPITFLDWDSVSQAKEKALDTMYKGKAVSERPSLVEVDLEHTRGRFSVAPVILRDIDTSCESERGWTRVNTLKHYKIESGAHFKLRPRFEPSKCDYIGTITVSYEKDNEQNSDTHLWHLSKPDDAESNSSSGKEKMASEVYLHRLLYSKNVLQKFVNDLFESIFEVNNVAKDGYPLAIRYFFEFLEDQSTKHELTDQEVLQTWKNNSLALRFWVNLIKNPEFVFSIYKSSTMDSCLLVIAQTFMDSFSVSNTKLNKDSPTSKLLYAKEVRTYKQSVANYYEDIRKLPKVTEDQMTEEMNSLSKTLQKADILDTDEALYQLFKYANRYSQQLYESLTDNGYNSLASHFQEILNQLSPEVTNSQHIAQASV